MTRSKRAAISWRGGPAGEYGFDQLRCALWTSAAGTRPEGTAPLPAPLATLW
ncbi:hypothetical protein [Saccharopolyspora sp. 5N708]|uniref:hypothetical protein n=1 Tax=Saccharopolyspora sp. 5N708 TaxID=3457424 RepID=UPI003FD55AFE